MVVGIKWRGTAGRKRPWLQLQMYNLNSQGIQQRFQSNNQFSALTSTFYVPYVVGLLHAIPPIFAAPTRSPQELPSSLLTQI